MNGAILNKISYTKSTTVRLTYIRISIRINVHRLLLNSPKIRIYVSSCGLIATWKKTSVNLIHARESLKKKKKKRKKKEDTRFSCTVKKPGGMPDHVPTNLKGRERNFMFLRGQPTSGIYFNCDLLCEVKLRGSACTYARANAVRRYQIDVVHFVARLFLSPKKGGPAHGYEFSPANTLSHYNIFE